MSQDDPKNIGTPEEGASEKTSRRRFLKGGAMAAVGALAAAVVPKAAEAAAGVFEEDCKTRVADIYYHPNDTLANMIVRAWNDNSYRDALLDDDRDTATFAQSGLNFPNVEVLTEAGYRAGGYCRKPNQVIFVLPDRPPGLNVALDQARVEMARTPFGM